MRLTRHLNTKRASRQSVALVEQSKCSSAGIKLTLLDIWNINRLLCKQAFVAGNCKVESVCTSVHFNVTSGAAAWCVRIISYDAVLCVGSLFNGVVKRLFTQRRNALNETEHNAGLVRCKQPHVELSWRKNATKAAVLLPSTWDELFFFHFSPPQPLFSTGAAWRDALGKKF